MSAVAYSIILNLPAPIPASTAFFKNRVPIDPKLHVSRPMCVAGRTQDSTIPHIGIHMCK